MSVSISKSIGLTESVQKMDIRRGTADIGVEYSILSLDSDVTLFLSDEAMIQLGRLISAHLEGEYAEMYVEVREPAKEESYEELADDEMPF